MDTTTRHILPFALENQNKHYDMLVYPGKENPYEMIRHEIREQLKRIGKRTDLPSKNKYKVLQEEFVECTDELDNTDMDDLQKAILLIKKLTPALKMNTGFNFLTPESYRAVLKKARSMAIFERDITAKPRKI